MIGNINYQVQQIYQAVNAIGQKKHNAKTDARNKGARSTEAVAKYTDIYSYATADAYRDVWRHIAKYALIEYGIKDLERLEGLHVSGYLESKIDDGIERATFDQYASGAAKLETALNRYAKLHKTGISYRFDLRDVRALGASELGKRNHKPRAYTEPLILINKLKGQFQLIAELQVESGARIKEISLIKKTQLLSTCRDIHIGTLKGIVTVKGKGGKGRELKISPETYRKLAIAISINEDMFELENYKSYLDALKEAALVSGQEYNGSHGLRWNFAQNRMSELQANGLSYEEALLLVSQEMGHERSDITEHYLR